MNKSGYAQVKIRNTSLIADTNILYIRVNNIIEITGINTNVKLIAKPNIEVSDKGKNIFIISPKGFEKISLFAYSGQKLLVEKNFTADTLPELQVQFGNLQKDTASISEILANRGLRAIYKGSLYYKPIRIIEYRTTFIGPGLDTLAREIVNEGPFISLQQQTIVRQLHPGSKILFHAIRAVGADSIVRELWPFYLYIK